jgi:hypothetical protein
MSDLCRLIWRALIGLFRPRAALEAEILVLRHQLNVLRRKSPKRLAFGNVDRLVFTALYRVAPGLLDALQILKPQTVIRWHRAGFRAYWHWKPRPRGGRPNTPADIRQLIRDMSIANPLWGAPRIHGELLKLGIDVGQTTVAKYMARRRRCNRRHDISFAIGIACMALSSSSGFAQWAYGIGRSRHGRHGKTGTRRGSSVRSDGIVLTMLLCSANDISAIYSIHTKNITMRLARTYRCTRTRRSHVASRLSVARWRSQFWAGCITNISEHKFPTGTGVHVFTSRRCSVNFLI